MTGTTARSETPAEHRLDQYVRFWNAATEQEQHELAAAAFADGVEYRAETGILSGAQALMDFRNQFVAHMGGAALRLRERPRVHHDRARLRWQILTEGGDGAPFATGTDVIHLDEDGRITSVTAFLDQAPVGFDPAAHH
ncbi:nuclear transport factor 2 family protein [Streptomyces paradoxus]|uniref:nuclear transport factor 2 family protein n=1 Tax=Streptomyces paradoxus TaxID=66375 RepID=UPI00363040C5